MSHASFSDSGNALDNHIPLAISPQSLVQALNGVAYATLSHENVEYLHSQWQDLPSSHPEKGSHNVEDASNNTPTVRASLSPHQWINAIASNVHDDASRQLAELALGVAILREVAARDFQLEMENISVVWKLIHGTLVAPQKIAFNVARTTQGFLVVPIFFLPQGEVNEVLHLQVWLPGDKGYDDSVAMNKHSPLFNRSWVVAGQGRAASQYPVAPESDPQSTIVSDSGSINKTYGRFTRHRRDVEGCWTSFFSALCLYHSPKRGDNNATSDAVGQGAMESATEESKADLSPWRLASLVQAVRVWESQMANGQYHSYKAEWEHALREFNTALSLCDTMESLKLRNVSSYRQEVTGKLGCAYRRFGRYSQAIDLLEISLKEITEPNLFQADITGELAVVYRLMGSLDKAKSAAEMQYRIAKSFKSETEMCRAIGNLGMIHYQQFLVSNNRGLLEVAIEQIEERVRLARHITMTLDTQSSAQDNDRLKYAITHEAIGLARLSLCYTCHGDKLKAVESGHGSLETALSGDDSIVIAMSRFFYGRALLNNGQRDEAMKQLDPPETPCTPAMALCREPSEEHRGYLQELVEVGVDMSRANSDGYTALDYAVFSGDTQAAEIVLQGLRQSAHKLTTSGVESYIDTLHKESKLRRCYRELFQEKLRLAFHQRKGDDQHRLGVLRQAYARALVEDEEKRRLFEVFKVVPYSKFIQHKRIPHSKDGLAEEVVHGIGGTNGSAASFVIFFSYRWVNKGIGMSQPDDANHTQYNRMIAAVEKFLNLHPTVDREKLGVWVDLACVDQDNSAPGVAALLINLAQCDAIISLVDDDYYSRAWCSVEVLMVQTLKRAYNLQMWYEQIDVKAEGKSTYMLRNGPMDVETIMAEKKLTYEEDRPKLQFLERQTMLLA